jgi:hypothetical protein
MLLVDSIVVDDEVVTARFCCDVQACAGACCCLEGGRGAPLEDAEVPLLRESYAAAKDYLPSSSREIIEQRGPVEGVPGDYATVCIDRRECVFVYFDRGIAKCSIERAYLEGRTGWRKPLSCHLFPIRFRRFGQDFVRYEQIAECQSARERGAAEDVPLLDFVREALIRKFGEQWYHQLKQRGEKTTRSL